MSGCAGGIENEQRASGKNHWKILGEVEEMMSGRGVGILSCRSSDHHREKVFFRDREYGELERTIIGILGAVAQDEKARASPTQALR